MGFTVLGLCVCRVLEKDQLAACEFLGQADGTVQAPVTVINYANENLGTVGDQNS